MESKSGSFSVYGRVALISRNNDVEVEVAVVCKPTLSPYAAVLSRAVLGIRLHVSL